MESEELESRPTGTIGLSASTVREKNESMVLPLVIVWRAEAKQKGRENEREIDKEVSQDKNKKQEEQTKKPLPWP